LAPDLDPFRWVLRFATAAFGGDLRFAAAALVGLVGGVPFGLVTLLFGDGIFEFMAEEKQNIGKG
jgi:hypothetical protein